MRSVLFFLIVAALSCQNRAITPTSHPRTATESGGFRVFDIEERTWQYATANVRILYTDAPADSRVIEELRYSVADSGRFPTHPDWYEEISDFYGVNEGYERTYNYGMWALVEVSLPDGVARRGRNRYNVRFFVCRAEDVEMIRAIVTDAFRAGLR